MTCRGSLAVLIAIAMSCPGAAAAAPGALTAHRYLYADGYRGWPVAPRHAQHPVRGSFLDPRYPTRDYHWGVDINVRDDRPERGAPRGRTHRVYAVEGGAARIGRDAPGAPCAQRSVEVGHFSYWHVDATVRYGQYVRPGQMIGWTCKGAWHVHLGEWAFVHGRRVRVNPLHRGGKLRPYADARRPVIHEIGFHTPAMPPNVGVRLDPQKLRGVVDVRAWISDPQSFRGWMVGPLAPLLSDHHPYEVRVRLTRVANRRAWVWTLFRADVLLSTPMPSLETPVPFRYHYAPGSIANAKIRHCLAWQARPRPRGCNGKYRLRLFATRNHAYWDTRRFRNGRYRIRVTAFDIRGNAAAASVDATVAN